MDNNVITSNIFLENNIKVEISFYVNKDFKTFLTNKTNPYYKYDGYIFISLNNKIVISWSNIDYFIKNSLEFIQSGCMEELKNNNVYTENIMEKIKDEIHRIVELFEEEPELASKSSNVSSTLSRPAHYGGENNPFEAIKIIHHYNLNFNLGNIIKYTLRCGKKDEAIKELEKIKQYADFEIQRLNNIQN